MSIFHADAMCDGGDLDCGSGLLLIIKKHMDPLDKGQVLEVRSTDRTVADDLPIWCRMVKHDFLGQEKTDTYTSYYVKKGGKDDALADDLKAAQGYQWTVRVQNDEGLKAKIHSRNHSFLAGQPADFSPKVEAPSAVDYLLASLASCLTVGFKSHASRNNVVIDAMELTLKGKLNNVLYHMGISNEGNPSLEEINGTFYVTSPNEDHELAELWRLTIARSPIYQTLKNSTKINIKFTIVY